MLSALTPAQREAIKQLKVSDKEGLQVSPDLDLTSYAPTSVIVEFKDKPAQTAVMVAETEGTSLSEGDAQAKVDASHDTFNLDLKTI